MFGCPANAQPSNLLKQNLYAGNMAAMPVSFLKAHSTSGQSGQKNFVVKQWSHD